MKLSDIAIYVADRIKSVDISLEQYVTTDSILQDKKGRVCAQNMPPVATSLTHFQCGDVLVANIRPYLKKVWMADISGGCSPDVLTFRPKGGCSSEFLYAALSQDVFFEYVMKGVNGTRMPRGNKWQIMKFPLTVFNPMQMRNIGEVICSLDRKIELNKAINHNLEAMAKQLYDYWFVQFDFPDANGRPYKSSGGKMVWNDKLKREIPEGWSNTTLGELCDMYQPKTLGLKELSKEGKYRVYGANGIIGYYNEYNHENSEIAMACRGNSCGTINRTVPKSWITGNAMVIQMKRKAIHNEYIKQALGYVNIRGSITGSGQPQITRVNLNPISIIDPSDTTLQLFSQYVSTIVGKQLLISIEIDSLTTLRDELLPMLMNGQVSVDEGR